MTSLPKLETKYCVSEFHGDEISSHLMKLPCSLLLMIMARQIFFGNGITFNGQYAWPLAVSVAAVHDSNSLMMAGSHTIGDSRCTSFRQRLYNQMGNGLPDFTLDASYAAALRLRCPRSGGDQNLFFLDPVTPFKFDNQYYKNILAYRGLLASDEVLLTGSPATGDLVKLYAANQDIFFQHFAQSMVKMGNISPLTGADGEIRKHCRRVNHN